MAGNSLYSSRAALSHRGRGTRASQRPPGDSPAPRWAAAGAESGTRGVCGWSDRAGIGFICAGQRRATGLGLVPWLAPGAVELPPAVPEHTRHGRSPRPPSLGTAPRWPTRRN